MSSSRSSKSRKAEGSKETVNGNNEDSEIEEIEIDSDSEGGESSASDYKPKKPRDSSINKAAFSMPDDIKKLMERVTCCSCGKQLNPMNPGAVRKHPWLKVITCKKCYKFLRSGPFTRDNDGLDEQCRWCGEGGRLYGCDYCHNCFCRTCIKRNMGRSEAAVMENDDNSKWHCYMCKPKKIIKLVDDCEKILSYIEKEEKKEKEKEERAKQREKEKAERYKEKKRDEKSKKSEEKESRKEERDKKEDKDENSTPKRGFPAPRDKSAIAEKISSDKKDVGKSKGSIPQSKFQADLIVVEDSPIPTFGPLQKHHRAVEYKPDAKSGVTLVQKASNGVTEVHVGPKNDKVVVMPIVNRSAGRAPNPQVMTYINKPLLAGMLTQQTTKTFDRGLGKIMAQHNDIKALKNNIMPYNIENITERVATIAQSLSLTLNSAKTDLAIAKLSQTNMHSARQTAAAVVKNGFEYFFSQVREVFNVQVVTNFPQMNTPDLNAQGDMKTVSGHLTSTPNAKKEPQSLLLDTVTGVLDESAIPIEIDETSPVKKKEKMEVDEDEDSVVYVTDNESKEVKTVPLKDEKEGKEENVLPEDVKDQTPDLPNGGEEDQAKKNNTSDKDVKVDNSDGEVKAAENDETADTEKEIVAVNEEETETETRRNTRNANKANDKEYLHKKDGEKSNEESDIEEQGKVTRKSRSGNKVNDKEQKDKKGEERVNEDSDIEEQGKVTRKSRSGNKENDKEQKDKKAEEKVNEDSDIEDLAKVKRKSRSANKVNEKDKKDKVEDVDEESEDHKEVEKKTISSRSSKKGADKDEEQDKNKTVDEENKSSKKSDKKGKYTSKSSDGEKSDENKKDKEEENEVGMDQSENMAAELELLKEMEEEFNAESDEPRRSLRRRKKDESESKEGSDNDSPVRRSSRKRQKPEEGRETDKADRKKADSKKKKDKDESIEKDLSKDKKKKKVLEESDDDKTEENDDFDDDTSRASSVKDKKNSKSPKKSVNKSKVDIESEESDEAPKGKSKKDTKASKNEKEEKSSKKDQKVDDDDIPMEESDTTETSDSDESVAEFGKVKKRRKPVAKEETSRTTRQRGKKSEPSEPSDSDSDFDKDLEKEIKSLSRETKLSKKKEKEAKETKQETKEKKEKPKEKEKEKKDKKKGKKGDDEDDDDSDSSDDEPENLSGVEDDSSDEDTVKVSASQLKKLKQTGKAILEDDSDEDYVDPNNISDDSSDPEVSFPKLSTPKKGKRAKSEDQSDDSDFIIPKKKRLRVKDKLLDAKVSDSDSDTGKKGKKGKGKKGKGKRKKDDSDQFSELSDEDENRPKGKGKKRKRIRKIDSSDEEGAPKEPGEDDNVGSDEEDDGTPGGFLKRKQIRKVKSTKKLAETTKAAQKAEEDRRKRIEERQKEYNTYVEVEGGEEEEEVPEGTEREMTTPTKAPDSIAKILGSPRKIPVTTKCVLEMDKETKKPLIEVDKTLIRKLKPHQVEAVRFMYNCCVESIERLKKGDGSGCILAHCMGLGKTLSVISFVHTMLRNVKLTKMTKCLVVCPLNTVLNWVNEFEIWLDDVDFEIEVYEMSRVKQNFERAQMLKEWHEGGAGVMILGYDMYRNLVNGSHCKNKKQKKIFYDSLADPGPDIVVCDEGHILKNDATSLSKAMSKIKSPRRIVLTGTPLQNNLGEYHCMVSFVKPSLLGTRKEFNNRFNNPITNGQCSDSTAFDVKLMKRRAHILHELLAGCVQRKDYSALTKYLPPKFEYVISVRLSKVQMTLYEKYLDMVLGGGGVEGVKYKGARLFTDYQALMRIWTHPWVLKLDEIRQENKRMFDDEDEDSFIDDSNSEDDSFIDDDSTTSESNDDVDDDSDASKKKKGKGKSKKKKRNKKGSSSSDEDSKKEKDKDTGDEVVKKWTSKRRGNEEGAGSSWMMDMGYGNPDEGPKEVTSEWWAEFVKEGDEFKLELSGKLTLMFEILKMCEDIGDKVLVFSQSLLSLDIIEDFLSKIDEANQEITNADKPATEEEKPKEDADKPKENGEGKADGEKPAGEKSATEKTEKEKLNERLSHYGKSWSRGADYFRMDGSTNSQNRKAAQDMFNDPENYRARLFLISTKAGSLGINLVAANRVIIFDASWNPSHDIQSIFRVYRFGQVKPVYVYRFLAQGTMEAKIYERQVTKQSLSQRVVDEHQIERHFTANDLQELYKFQPDRLDDPNIKERPLLALPKDHMLAELMTHNKEWIVSYHEHDSLLENVTEQELTEEEKKAAWEDYEDEKKGISRAMGGMNMNINPGLYATQQMNMQNLLLQGQANLGQAAVLQIVQDLKARFPNLPPEVFQQRVQAVLRQVLTQQIMAQSEMQRRQIMEQSEMHRRQVEAQRMAELQRLNQIKQQIQRQQAMINSQQRSFGMAGMNPTMNFGMSGAAGGMQMTRSLLNPMTTSHSNMPRPPSSASIAPRLPDQNKK